MTEINKRIEIKSSGLEIVGIDFNSSTDQKYIADGVKIAASAFGVHQITQEFDDDVRGHIIGHRVIFAYNDRGEPVGFGSYDHLQDGGTGILYISGLVVNKETQGLGIGSSLSKEAVVDLRRRGYPVILVAGRTQSPVVAAARSSYCHPVYPIDAEPSPDIISAANMLLRHLNMTGIMDPRTLVTRNAYPHPLYEVRPQSKHKKINDFFARNVEPRDAVFIIGRPVC